LTITNGYASSSSDGGAYGGAIFATSTGVTLTFLRCTISSSRATFGSGIYVGSYGKLTMDYCTFYYNRGANSGGGLYFSGSTARLDFTEFSTNHASTGGGAYLSNGAVSMSSYSFESNAGSVGLDLYVESSATFTQENGCESGTYNYGSGLLLCSGCTIEYLPAVLNIQYFFPSPAPTITKFPSIPDPSTIPTPSPTQIPSEAPSPLPVPLPTYMPSPVPTSLPNPVPSSLPTPSPEPTRTNPPSNVPLSSPTYFPVLKPTALPSNSPRPSNLPTMTQSPTTSPSVSSKPTALPTESALPSSTPTSLTSTPTPQPTFSSPFRRRLQSTDDTYSSWCAESTPLIEVDTQEYLAASVMPNRTVNLIADIYLSSTLYFLIGLNDGLDGFVIDGGGEYKLDGQGHFRCVFVVGSELKMALKDLTVTNGYASSGSTYGYYGGAIYVGGGAVLELNGCTVSSSATESYGHGGAIYVDAATLILTDTIIKNNHVNYGKGGGVYLSSLSKLSMTGGSITSNAQFSGYNTYTAYYYDDDDRTHKSCT